MLKKKLLYLPNNNSLKRFLFICTQYRKEKSPCFIDTLGDNFIRTHIFERMYMAERKYCFS